MAGLIGKKWRKESKKEVKSEKEVLMAMDDLQRDMLKKFAIKCVEGQQQNTK